MQTRIVFFFLVIGIYGCTFDEEVLTPVETKLSVEVLDEDGVPQSEAKVQLYLSLEDLQSRNNPLESRKTNPKGVAEFTGMAAQQYFVYASFVKDHKVYDNEAVGDVRMEKLFSENSHYQFVTITGFKRPLYPKQLKIKACWLMDYPTPISVYGSADTSIQASNPVEVEFYLGEDYLNRVGPLHFYSTNLQADERQDIALAEYLKSPNPSISLDYFKEYKLNIHIFEQDLQKKQHLKSKYSLNMENFIGGQTLIFPDRIPVFLDDIQLDLIVQWE